MAGNAAEMGEALPLAPGAKLVGDAPRDLLPPGVPADLDLRGWRWALSNPICFNGRDAWPVMRDAS